MECMLSWAIPASMALIPVAAESIGPTVPPDLESFLIWKIWSLQSDLSAMRAKRELEVASVVMCPLLSAQTVIPTLNLGM